MVAPPAPGLRRNLLQAIEAAKVVVATALTKWLADTAKTILWPNRLEVRELCAKTACSLLTDNTCLRGR